MEAYPCHKDNRQLFGALGLKPISSSKIVLGRLDQICEPLVPQLGNQVQSSEMYPR